MFHPTTPNMTIALNEKKKNGQGYMKTPVTNTSDSTHMVIHCTGKEWQSKNKSLVWYLLCKALSFSHLG